MAAFDITALDTKLEFDTTNALNTSIVRLPSANKIAIAWKQSTTLFYVQCFSVNTGTGAIAAIGSPLDIEAGTGGTGDQIISLCAIDGSNLAVFWLSTDNDGGMQLLSVDGTGNVTANGSKAEFDTQNAGSISNAVLMDSTHILLAWKDDTTPSSDAVIVSVNTGTGVIAVVGTALNFASPGDSLFGSIAKLSSTKAVVFYAGGSDDGFSRVLDINTSTWAVTAAGAEFEYKDSATIVGNSVVAIDTAGSPMKVINGYLDNDLSDAFIRSFQIDTTTWAITAFGAQATLSTDTSGVKNSIAVNVVDSTHIIVAYPAGTFADGFIKVMTYDAGGGDLSDSANTVTFDSSSSVKQYSMCAFTDVPGLFVLSWSGNGDGDGYVQAFQVTMTPADQNISVSDTLNITESVSRTEFNNISISDAITITESVSVTEFNNISVTDQLNITESVSRTEFNNISISDAITITENVIVQDTQLIYFDAAANSGDIAAASSFTGSASWNGSNRLLAVDVSMLGPGVTVTSMTYGGANCTLVGVQSTVTSFGRVEQWRIVSSDPGAPGVGANTLVVTLSGSIEFSVEWVSYTGVHQTKPTEAFNSAQATNVGVANDASVVITTIADNDWVHAAVVANDTTIVAGNTSRNNISGTLGSGANEDNGGAKTPPGTVTMSYSGMGITTTWAIAGYGIRPLTAIGDVSVFDAITISENYGDSISISISVSDTIIISENISTEYVNAFSVVDALTITESVTASNPLGYANVFDAITITENTTLDNNQLPGINVVDNIIITENYVNTGEINRSIFDAITITESISILSIFNLSVFDAITITEDIGNPIVLNNLSVFDAITITESISVLSIFNISVFDAITITESITASNPLGYANVFDAITITENYSNTGQLTLSVFDTITITESITGDNPLTGVSVYDSIILTENHGNMAILSINVTDGLSISSISENVQVELQNDVSTYDIVTIAGSVSLESFRFSPSIRRPVGHANNTSTPIGTIN